jgi:two-component system response regulator
MPPARVFIVDDDEDDLDLLRDLLTKAAVVERVAFFKDVRSLLAQLSKLSADTFPSLILSDLNMPGLSGLELLNIIRQSGFLPLIDVIIISTSRLPSDVDRCIAAGAKTFLEKPIDLSGYQKIADCLKLHLENKAFI